MMRCKPWALPATFCLLLSTTVAAQVESGPEVGKATPALTVRAVMNGQAAEAADITKERAEHLTVYVFLPASRLDRPTARVVKGLDGALQKVQVQHPTAGLIVVWMADDADAGALRVSQIQGSLQLSAQWAVFAGQVNGPDGWALSDRAALTAVVARQGKIVSRFGYDSANETVLPELEKAITAAAH
jgi:hypothetical protein